VVEIRGDWAVRRARFMFPAPIKPYHGGAIEAIIQPSGQKTYGYIHSANLIDFKEIPFFTSQAAQNTDRILNKQRHRFERLLGEAGFKEWNPEGFLNLEGFDSGKGIVIYSMSGRAVDEDNFITKPVLVVWATPDGKILKLRLITLTHFAERG
jgi:hypothetical protein